MLAIEGVVVRPDGSHWARRANGTVNGDIVDVILVSIKVYHLIKEYQCLVRSPNWYNFFNVNFSHVH